MAHTVRLEYTERENATLALVQTTLSGPDRPTNPEQRRDFEIEVLHNSPELIPILARKEAMRAKILFKEGVYTSSRDYYSDLEVCLLLGYWRALLYGWMDENGYDNDWLVQKRKEYHELARNGRDRSADTQIFLREVADLSTYYPKLPVDIFTVMDLARREYTTMTNVFVTPRNKDGKVFGVYIDGIDRDDWATEETDLILGALRTDPESEFFCPEILRGEEELSPVLLLIAERFIGRYGPRQTVYWLCNKLYFKGNIVELLKAFGGDPRSKTFEAMERDLRRKLPQMDEALKEFKNNKDLLSAFEYLLDQ